MGDLDELLNRIVNTVGPGLNVARCMIGLYPANSRGYTFQYVYRAPDAPDTGQLVMVGYNENPSFQMLVCGEIYCCHDTASDPRFVALRHFYSTHHIGATLFAGLQRNDEWLGSLGLHQCDGPRQWGGAEVAILRLIADQVALAIDLIRFRERAQQQKENLAHQSRELKL
ncbi:MAG: GAF domain-containing protein, partial [Pirellulaceae bacterium]|nr:GAF domain-containing protein [Pirellulaceae bacterium]